MQNDSQRYCETHTRTRIQKLGHRCCVVLLSKYRRTVLIGLLSVPHPLNSRSNTVFYFSRHCRTHLQRCIWKKTIFSPLRLPIQYVSTVSIIKRE